MIVATLYRSVRTTARVAALASLFAFGTRSFAQSSIAYDRIAAAYAPYMDAHDPYGWPMKAWSLSANEYRFWRGSKDLFFAWCKTHCDDWASDASAAIPCHGDLHMGNIGTYASDASFGPLAFGMVDFDDSAQMPFQIELLEGFITLRLMAPPGADIAPADAAMIDAYRVALSGDRGAMHAFADDPTIARMLHAGDDVPYADEIATFTANGRFRERITNAKGKVSELLRGVDAGSFDAFADALAQACANDPACASRFADPTPAGFRSRIRDVAQRTRIGSSGSQGLRKYLVLLSDRPLVGQTTDVLIYLKQEIPSAAERAGFVPLDRRPAGERVCAAMAALVSPRPFILSHASIDGRSYWVSLKEPWSSELSDTVDDGVGLLRAARLWGLVAGAGHRQAGAASKDGRRLSPALIAELAERADAYLQVQHDEYRTFVADPRTRDAIDQAERSIDLARH